MIAVSVGLLSFLTMVWSANAKCLKHCGVGESPTCLITEGSYLIGTADRERFEEMSNSADFAGAFKAFGHKLSAGTEIYAESWGPDWVKVKVLTGRLKGQTGLMMNGDANNACIPPD